MTSHLLTGVSGIRPQQFSDEQILSVARECFVEHGPSVSTARIAEKAGVSQATLFKRFGTKAVLLRRALWFTEITPWLERIEAGPTDEAIHIQLVEFGLGIARVFDRMIPCMIALRLSGTPDNNPDNGPDSCEKPQPPLRARHGLSAWFRAAQEAGRLRRFETDTAAIAFLGMLQAPAFRRHVLQEEIDIDCYVVELVDALWRGFAP